MTKLERRARDFAMYHHGIINHRRKYTGHPYILHPASVVKLVRSVPHSEEMLAAAWLHDVVEDTEASICEVAHEFGLDVGDLVWQLTDRSKKEDGNRETRKAIDRAHTAKACPDAKTIKLADLIDNSYSIARHAPGFAKVYMQEKVMLLPHLIDGDCKLFIKANEIVSEYYQRR